MKRTAHEGLALPLLLLFLSFKTAATVIFPGPSWTTQGVTEMHTQTPFQAYTQSSTLHVLVLSGFLIKQSIFTKITNIAH